MKPEPKRYVQPDGRAAVKRKRGVCKDNGPVVLMAEWIEKLMRHRRWPCVYEPVAFAQEYDDGSRGKPVAVRFYLNAAGGDEAAFRLMLDASVYAVVARCVKMRPEDVYFDGEYFGLTAGYWVNSRGEVRPGAPPVPF